MNKIRAVLRKIPSISTSPNLTANRHYCALFRGGKMINDCVSSSSSRSRLGRNFNKLSTHAEEAALRGINGDSKMPGTARWEFIKGCTKHSNVRSYCSLPIKGLQQGQG